jgi:hypothetical protein
VGLRSWLHTLSKRKSPQGASRPRNSGWNTFRPQFELLEDRIAFSASALLDVVGGALTYSGIAITPNNTLSVSSTGGAYLFSNSAEGITLGNGAIAAGWRNVSASSVKGPEASITGAFTINADSAVGDLTALGSFENMLPASLSVNLARKITVQSVSSRGAQSYAATTSTTLSGVLTTVGSPVTITGSAVLGGSASMTIDTTNLGASPAGANVSFNGTVNGAQSLSIDAGAAGAATILGSVGGSTILTSLAITGKTIEVATAQTFGVQTFAASSSTTLNGSLTTSAGSVSVTGPVVLGGTITIDTTNGGIRPAGGNVTFTNTIDGALGLSVVGGALGAVAFQGAIGASTPLFSLAVSSKTITAAAVTTGGAQSFTGATSVTLNGNLSTTGGSVTVTGPAILGGTVTVNTTSGDANPFGPSLAFGGGNSAGANIVFSSTVNATTAGGQTLTLNSGSSGAVTLGGAVGGGKALASLTIAAGGLTTLDGSITTSQAGGGSGNVDLSQASGTITLGVNVTVASNNGVVNLSGSTINASTLGGQRLIVNAGNGPVTLGSEGLGTALNSLTVTTSGVTILAGDTIDTTTAGGGTGAVNLLGATGGITLQVSVGINTQGGSVNLLGSGLNGATVGGQSLTVTAGAGAVRLGTAGLGKALASITESGSSVAEADVVTTGPESYTGTTTVNINGDITTSGATVTITGPANLLLPLQSPPTVIDTTAGGTVPVGANVSFSSTLDGVEPFVIVAGTGGAVSFGGTVGGITPLTSLAVSAGSAVLEAVHVAGSGSIGITANTISINGVLDPAVGGASITLDSTGGAVTENTGGSISASSLLLLGAGPFTLNQPGNHVSTIAGNVSGDLQYTDAGALTVGSLAGTNGLTTSSSLTLVTGGTLTIRDSSATSESVSASSFTLTPLGPPPQSGVVSIGSNGVLSGSGTINGNLTNGGLLSPGGTGAAGTITATGNYLQTAAGALDIELGAVGAGNSDLLIVDGQASLGGALSVSRLPSFSDVLGNSYQVLQFNSQTTAADGTGVDFASRNGLILPSGHILNPVYHGSANPNLTLVDTAAGVDVTGSVTEKFSGFRFTAPATYKQQVTITNTSGSTLSGPIQLLLVGLNSNISLANRTGIGIASDAGDPYITLQVGSLAAGQSVSVVLNFFNPGLFAINYTALVFAGGVP